MTSAISMNTYRIALYPGDGIGTEVLDAAIEVIEAARQAVGGFELLYDRFDWGMSHYDRHGRVVPDDFLATPPAVRTRSSLALRSAGRTAMFLPDGVALAPLIQLRQAFDLYANIRPAQTFRGVQGPLQVA